VFGAPAELAGIKIAKKSIERKKMFNDIEIKTMCSTTGLKAQKENKRKLTL